MQVVPGCTPSGVQPEVVEEGTTEPGYFGAIHKAEHARPLHVLMMMIALFWVFESAVLS